MPLNSQGLRYHERRALGYGTTRERLGKVIAWYHLSLSLSLSPPYIMCVNEIGFTGQLLGLLPHPSICRESSGNP